MIPTQGDHSWGRVDMKNVRKRRGVRALVVLGIIGVVTVALASQAAACVCAPPAPHVVGGTFKQANPNNTITTPVAGVAPFETVVVSVATGTFAGSVGCTDNLNRVYQVVIEKNTGSGRLFVCSLNVGSTPPTSVTANYPGFSGLSVTSVVAIPDVGPPLASNANSDSNPPVNSGIIHVGGDNVLFGVVANTNVSTFAADAPWSTLTAQSGGAGAGKRTLTPVYRVVGGAAADYAVSGRLTGSGFWQAAIIQYPAGCSI
jgi:hypothetical protein